MFIALTVKKGGIGYFLRRNVDLLSKFKQILGFKEPCNIDLSQELTPPPQHIHHKERVTEFAAEIGTLLLTFIAVHLFEILW